MMRVPVPGVERTIILPPMAVARSRMLDRPCWACARRPPADEALAVVGDHQAELVSPHRELDFRAGGRRVAGHVAEGLARDGHHLGRPAPR